MKNIGEKLRLAREKQGIPLEEMSNRTKIAVDRLKAIEEGNIGFFDDDISYLRYYIRFYCNALKIDYEQFRDQLENAVDEFHTTLKLQKIEETNDIERSIKKKAEVHNIQEKLNKKLDLPMLSLIVIVIILLIALTSVFFVYILPQWRSPDPSFQHSDPIVNPDITDEPDENDPIVDVPTTSKLQFSAVDSRTYQIIDWYDNEEVAIKITFGRDTWIKVFYDGEASDNPASKIYQKGTSLEILYNAKKDSEIMIHLGGMNGNSIFINDKQVELSQSIANFSSGLKLTFIFKGE